MPQAIKKLKQDEKKVVLAYASLKLKANRLSKELDTMKEHIVNLFERTNQNLIIVQDENGNSFGLQKINRVRKSFDKDKFKLSHLDLWNTHQKQIEYCEYKAIGEVSNAK
jgi:ribosomal protein RSM22 (predicted rRNA methylase)